MPKRYAATSQNEISPLHHSEVMRRGLPQLAPEKESRDQVQHGIDSRTGS
ncbi:MAG TPA: hypothetical protein VIJ06_06875 [Methylovirgula sp.]